MFAIFLIAVMDFLGFGIILPLLPRYVPEYKEHALKVTLIFAIYSICQFIGAPILGALSDRWGRRPVLVVSQLGSAVGYLMLGFAPWAGVWTLTIVYASRIIDGFTGGNISTAQAYVADVTTPANRAKGMGMLGAAFGIGFSLGPAMGAVLSHFGGLWVSPNFGSALPAWVAMALATLAAVLSWRTLRETRSHKPTEAQVWLHPRQFLPIFRNGVIVQILVISFFIMAAFVMMESTLVLFLDTHFGLNNLGTGLFFGWLGLCIIIVQGGLVGRLTKKYGEWPLAILGPLLVAAGMAAFTGTAWAATIPLLMLAGAVNAGGRSLQQPAISSLLSKYADPKEQGTVFGVYHGLSSLARVAGPIVAGLTYPLLRNTGQFVTAGVIALAMAVWTYMLKRQAGRPVTPEPAAEAAAAEPA
ncbi:MFS transporter [Humisphaera borealis]|uniref:MFS transporter n=1 Tax=Humisphaera borealis TaxID=2807512 RepID=A0A7M2WQY3_9BACT|nr:MFS transporter [Humisphaera borealis]QOV87908.1 MFS transporter [Humisphaera borealis]